MDLPSHFLPISDLILGLVLCYNHWRGKSKSLTRNSNGMPPPEPSGAWPIIGHLHLLQGNVPVFRTLATMADKLGPVLMIRLGMHRTVVVSDHVTVKECFTTNDKIFASRPNSAAAKILGYNYALFALAPYRPLWREMRKISILEFLSTIRLTDSTHVRVSELHAGIKDLYMLGKDNNWVNPQKVVMCEWFENLNFNVILMMVAGMRYFNNVVHGGDEARSTMASLKKLVPLVGTPVVSEVIPFLECLDLQGHLSSMKDVAKELDSIVAIWVEEHKGKLNSGRDFIDVLLAKLGDASLFGYSRETVIKATVLAQEELDIKVGRDRWVEQSDIQNLVYLKAIVKEALRLYAAGPLLIPHEAMEDCCIGGYHIPKGTRLLVNAWKTHRDPAVWSNPEEFQPERFLINHATVDVFGHNFELIPFGSGRRSCLGANMGLQMLHLTIARLLQGFDMTTPSNSSVDMTEEISLSLPKATQLEVMLTPRLRAEL